MFKRFTGATSTKKSRITPNNKVLSLVYCFALSTQIYKEFPRTRWIDYKYNWILCVEVINNVFFFKYHFKSDNKSQHSIQTNTTITEWKMQKRNVQWFFTIYKHSLCDCLIISWRKSSSLGWYIKCVTLIKRWVICERPKNWGRIVGLFASRTQITHLSIHVTDFMENPLRSVSFYIPRQKKK